MSWPFFGVRYVVFTRRFYMRNFLQEQILLCRSKFCFAGANFFSHIALFQRYTEYKPYKSWYQRVQEVMSVLTSTVSLRTDTSSWKYAFAKVCNRRDFAIYT